MILPISHLVKRAEYDGNVRLVTGYVPSLALALLATLLFGILCICAWTQYLRIKRQRYMLTLCIGLATLCFGYIIRIPFRYSPGNVPLYAVTTLFVLLSPCAFLALEYMLLSRLAIYLGRDTVAKRCMLFRANIIAKFFVTSDVITFLVQGAGGGLSASGDPSSADLGHKISMVGVVLQAVAFGTFMIFLVYFGIRTRKLYPQKWHVKKQYQRGSLFNIFSREPVDDWRILYFGMLLAGVGFMVRSVFRAVEFSQGYDGYIVTTESYFYLLDALPIFLSCSILVALFPPKFMMRPQLFAGEGSLSFEKLEMQGSQASA